MPSCFDQVSTECLEKLTHNDNIKIDYGWYSC